MTDPAASPTPDAASPGVATAEAPPAFDERAVEEHRRELTGYCYRMLGSSFEAEDAVQETMVRAWRAYDGFEGRSSLRSWLYRIAHNVCLDQLRGRKRRANPMDLSPASSLDGPLVPLAERSWVEPIPDGRALSASDDDPAEQAEARESIRLAFMAALQHLPPKQRAVLILREVLRWQATEVAELLDTTVASVNSALQRARATLATQHEEPTDPLRPDDEDQRALLARYLEAFEAYDMDSLVGLLHEDATIAMPPFSLWLEGRDNIIGWFVGRGSECRGSRMIPVVANGQPAFGQYRPSGPGGRFEPWALQVIDIVDGRITGTTAYVEPALFPLFGLPPTVD